MTKHVLLYGDSIVLAGLAAQLQSRIDLEVYQRSQHSGLLALDKFNVVIVDFDNVESSDVLAMLRARPDLKVIGVNAPDGAVMVLSGKVYLARALTEVVTCLDESNAPDADPL